jgi:hypothetical protein
VTDFLVGLDVSIYRALNDFVGWNPTFDRILANHEILKGPLFALIIGVLWYWPEQGNAAAARNASHDDGGGGTIYRR